MVPPAELPIVRMVVGEEIFGANEQLVSELDALRDMWRMLREANEGRYAEDEALAAGGTPRTRPQTPLRGPRKHVHASLAAQLRAVLNGDVDQAALPPPDSAREAEIRAMLADPGKSKTSESARRDALGGRHAVKASESADEVVALQPDLTALRVDAVKPLLLEALAREHAILLQEVAYLQACLEAEVAYKPPPAPPTLDELRVLEGKLMPKGAAATTTAAPKIESNRAAVKLGPVRGPVPLRRRGRAVRPAAVPIAPGGKLPSPPPGRRRN
ncbi:uncharacterized protein AMSG_03936 [Thecamonas trahens ATCC 50062]|uniref:Uncharacterized protein n=1 Tax=Thecamonas trahens ATCC 50062 TaxID=461836 RepID=A0A0L0D682_THETB|nr:hypothetical protein AMSG_03936 [Thecamonas trahens ATCC 50062]KNC47705.1 hypothetical protein AMSG_03936 [Thecamonas trahens ATCC 50062]|eukprot:XP_013759187.1 hypothetical protein AMSG_03936 [Thecamonas trahens ATCC 50062]